MSDRPLLSLIQGYIDSIDTSSADSRSEKMCMTALVPLINTFGYKTVQSALTKLKDQIPKTKS